MMYGVLGLVLAACVASAQGYTCSVCVIPGQDFCCTKFWEDDTHFCCSKEDYYLKGGFLTQQTLIIAAVVTVAVLVLLFCLCCCCCSCCPCYRRRQSGAVYNSVVLPSGSAYGRSTATYYPAQYPQQHSSDKYTGPNPSAPPAYPTLPPLSQA